MAGLRPLTPADVADGLALSTAASWNQTESDWRRALTLPGTAGWGIEREGRIVATTTAIRYGRELAWIGMVLTEEAHRGQGLASELMRAALEWLADCALVKLDATAQGAPLYRRFGFADESIVTRYVGRPTAVETPGVRGVSAGADAFEADRSALLAALGRPMCLEDGSFAYGRAGRVLPFFGPCVASEESGRRLLSEFAREQDVEFLLDRIGVAPEGFRAARQLTRMYRGRFQRTSERQYAMAGFEFG